MRTGMRVLPVVGVLVALSLVIGGSVALLGYYRPFHSGPALPIAVGASWLLFAGAIVLLRRVPVRAATVLVLVGTAAIGGAAMAGPPNTSTDSARYAWDGIVQTNGISPYRYVPTSAALRDLRPDWLFPAPVERSDGTLGCTGARIQTSHEPGSDTVVCTALNRGLFRTIYPPAAELLYAGVRLIVGPEAQYWPLQLVGLLLSLGVSATLLHALRRRGRDPRWAALWGWCPLVASEAVANSHIDVLGALLLLVATLAASSGGGWRAGLALGAAMSTKFIPVIGAPALLGRRGSWRVVVGAVAVFAVLYVPYLLQSGTRVLGYLPRYLTEEGYRGGSRFALLAFLPGRAALVVAALLLVVTAVLVWRKTDPESPFLGQVAMIGITLLVVSPRYPWYALLLLPMVAMTGRWEWLAIALALSLRQLVPLGWVFQLALLVALVAVVSGTILRAGPGWRGRVLDELRHPLRRPRAPSPTVGS